MQLPKIFQRKKPATKPVYVTAGVTGNIFSEWLGYINQDKLGDEKLLNTIKKCPHISKAYTWITEDLVSNWFEIDSPLDSEDVPENIEKTITDFIKEKRVKKKIYQMVWDGKWQGNGWIELVTDGDKEPESELSGNLVDIAYVDTRKITGYKYYPEGHENYGEIEFWTMRKGTQTIKIHSSRLLQFAPNKIGNDPFGYSDTETAWNAVAANNTSIKALANLINVHAHPYLYNNTGQTSQKSIDDAFKMMQDVAEGKIKAGLVGGEGSDMKILNPSAIEPRFIMDAFYTEFSSAVKIPKMLLVGEQTGHLTGSGHELKKYYDHIDSVRNIQLTPIMNHIFTLLLGDSWKYDIYWNPNFIDEKSEIENKTKWIEWVSKAYQIGVIDVIEARQLLREMDISVPEGNPLDELEPIEEEEPQEILPQITDSYKKRLPTPEELERAEELRKLGIKELAEQEKRLQGK